jgi:hypothetical protein
MKPYSFLLIFCMLIFSGCDVSESPNVKKDTFWVYTSRIPCNNLDTTVRCLYILNDDKINYDINQWTRLDEEYILVDFDYERGYFYQIEVQKPNAVDPNPFEYKVLRVLQKVKDYSLSLNAGWYVRKIFTNQVPEDRADYFYIHIEDWRRTILANADCRSYFGSLGMVGDSDFSLISLDEGSSDPKENCEDFGMIDALLSSKKYDLIDSDSLILKNENQEVLMILERMPGYNPYGPKKP